MTEESQVLEDYSLEPVPYEKRRSWVALAVIWIGIAVVMALTGYGSMERLKSLGRK
ncbi:MAG: hypothetical protein WBB73_06455 [Candidatus Aminicenantaceae bacterium]